MLYADNWKQQQTDHKGAPDLLENWTARWKSTEGSSTEHHHIYGNRAAASGAEMGGEKSCCCALRLHSEPTDTRRAEFEHKLGDQQPSTPLNISASVSPAQQPSPPLANNPANNHRKTTLLPPSQ